jgi:hypothetical protein
MEWTSIAKDSLTVAFTFAGLEIARQGLETWKKQIQGIKVFEVAYDLRYSVLKLRDAIKHVRNPAIWPSENNRAVKYFREKHPDTAESDTQKEEDPQPYVYEMRWEEITNAFTEVESYLLGAEVLWGTEILTLMKPLKTKIVELNIALSQRFQPKEFQTKTAMELHGIIYDQGNENGDDPFSKEVALSIKNITDYIKQKTS